MKTLSPESLLVISLILGAIPIMIAIGTCYLKFSIVLSLLRSGFGTQQAPSSSMVVALSMVLSLLVMQPVLTEIRANVSERSLAEIAKGRVSDLFVRSQQILQPWHRFLLAHCGERELEVFRNLSVERSIDLDGGAASGHSSLLTALAAFVLSEIKRGFVIAFVMILPLFVVDLVVGNILVALGLTMMSPSTVSLPIKLLLFVACDGWLLIANSLISAYR